MGKPPEIAMQSSNDELAISLITFSSGEIRVTHEQNLVLPHVKKSDLFKVVENVK